MLPDPLHVQHATKKRRLLPAVHRVALLGQLGTHTKPDRIPAMVARASFDFLSAARAKEPELPRGKKSFEMVSALFKAKAGARAYRRDLQGDLRKAAPRERGRNRPM